jgi:hypothetical protein
MPANSLFFQQSKDNATHKETNKKIKYLNPGQLRHKKNKEFNQIIDDDSADFASGKDYVTTDPAAAKFR